AVAEAAAIAKRLDAAPLLADARELARQIGVERAEPTVRASSGPERLTPRECEVLRLVAEGHRNREIAERLFISPKTASVHVSRIIAKLAVGSRGAAVAAARRRGLLD
ncbi:MAG: helix-turn-helix transcriptional regulator, partial [Dactylosporangium sp.]|nr:helix-turn-helix transcriptional regulator [Dactylosporangium sp.]NNJ62055.1 helix-turn-helix transcriptional regulator [Dactylosporangium sp.]